MLGYGANVSPFCMVIGYLPHRYFTINFMACSSSLLPFYFTYVCRRFTKSVFFFFAEWFVWSIKALGVVESGACTNRVFCFWYQCNFVVETQLCKVSLALWVNMWLWRVAVFAAAFAEDKLKHQETTVKSKTYAVSYFRIKFDNFDF